MTATATIAKLPETTTSPHDEYVSLLKRHDWSYQYSDDYNAYSAGRDEAAHLAAMKARLGDKDGAIWNVHAPDGYRIGSAA